MKEYDHKKIEKKWQTVWEKNKIYQAKDSSKKPKFYGLIEFPYPSGSGLHVGHIRSNTAMDIISRKRRMEGFNVLYPMGWDAFGLPTENYAIKTGIQPSVVTKKNTDIFRKQLKAIGFSFDWSREINTTDTKYYKWTQWIFLQFLKKGLAYKAKMTINWCPKDKIGLANEEVVDGCCERCGTVVEKREKEQWMLAITKYADRLYKDLDDVNYLPQIKLAQRNWIGKSEGVNFRQKIKDLNIEFEVYDSIPQTFLAQTFTVIAPEHKLIPELVKGTKYEKEVLAFIERITKKKSENRFDVDKEIEGIFTGRYVENPFGTGDFPLWIATYVVADYGTGIVNCSAHDERDFNFAKKYNIPLKVALLPEDKDLAEKVKTLEVFYREPNGILQLPFECFGLRWHAAREKVIDYIEKKGYGKRTTQFKLRDWIFSRQRYWGEPIPVVHCDKCGIVPVPEKDLPVELPKVKNYQPTDSGESPLANITKWVNVKCPKCKGKARRETDTMPNWAGSSWYYLRYTDPKNNKEFASKKNLKYWLGSDPASPRLARAGQGGVDWYNGGNEHTTLHLLYSRFWHKFLFDQGLVPTNEPYIKRTSHGMILGEGGVKMSKSLGNIINPDDIVKIYGADTLRIYEMFMGPFDQSVAWSTESIIGSRRFIERVWNLQYKVQKNKKYTEFEIEKTIKKVSEDIEEMKFNTAISTLMIFVNEVGKNESISQVAYEKFLKIISPFAPHVAEEIYFNLGNKNSIHLSGWPKWDENLMKDEEVKIMIQINGKVRGEIMIKNETTEEEVKKQALNTETVLKNIAGKEVKKVIYVKNRLINIVV